MESLHISTIDMLKGTNGEHFMGTLKGFCEYFIGTIGHGDTHWDLILHDKTPFNKCS